MGRIYQKRHLFIEKVSILESMNFEKHRNN